PDRDTHNYWIEIGDDSTTPPFGQTPVYPTVTAVAGMNYVDLTNTNPKYTTRTFVRPTFMSFAGDPNFPAFAFFNDDPAVVAMQPGPAADTDNDGIPAAMLFRMPVGTINGVDYFAAVRVVDNGSALNAATAWSPSLKAQPDFLASGTPVQLRLAGDFFP